MKCPNCAAENPEGSAECASCGVIFAKLKAKKERTVLEAKAGEALTAAKPEDEPAAFNPWKGRAIAGGIVVLWIAGFAIYYHRAVADALKRARVEVKSRPSVMVRDPDTGEMRQVPVVTTPPTGRLPPPPSDD